MWKNIEKDHKRCDGRVNDKSERQDDVEDHQTFRDEMRSDDTSKNRIILCLLL